MRRIVRAFLLVLALPARAADDEAIAYKFTPDFYSTTNEHSAYDLNLRGKLGPHAAWIGYYRRGEEFDQLRAGYEGTFKTPIGTLIPSAVVATHGFVGGSVNALIGDRYFGIVGLGRTNLADYFNLNFDPNDAVTFGAGTSAIPDTTLLLFQVKDNRLHTGQRVNHFVARTGDYANGFRWTVDVFHRSGRETPDSALVRGTGVALTCDYHEFFVRVANDPHVNFTPDRMVRLAVGVRF